MADEGKKKLQPVDFVGIRNLLNHLVAENAISCDERDRIIQRIAKDNDLPKHDLPVLTGYERSKNEVLEHIIRKDPARVYSLRPDESYVSMTEIARVHSDDPPGYVIQSWLRSGSTLAFLNLWEKENNPNYRENGYKELLEKKKASSFTLTPKLWISQTKAIGIISKQGKFGGTFAHPLIACEFASWLTPEFKMLLLTLSLNRGQLK